MGTVWLGGAVLRPIEWVVKASEQPLTVAIYQPNVPQERKWDPNYYRVILDQLKRASTPLVRSPVPNSRSHVLIRLPIRPIHWACHIAARTTPSSGNSKPGEHIKSTVANVIICILCGAYASCSVRLIIVDWWFTSDE